MLLYMLSVCMVTQDIYHCQYNSKITIYIDYNEFSSLIELNILCWKINQ